MTFWVVNAFEVTRAMLGIDEICGMFESRLCMLDESGRIVAGSPFRWELGVSGTCSTCVGLH